jgi:cutinase
VIDLITIAQAPVAGLIPQTLSADVADHVAAVATFGNPSDRYLGAPVSVVSPWYGAKAVDLCASGDPVCTPGGALALLSIADRKQLVVLHSDALHHRARQPHAPNCGYSRAAQPDCSSIQVSRKAREKLSKTGFMMYSKNVRSPVLM